MHSVAQGETIVRTNGSIITEKDSTRPMKITCINPATHHVVGEVSVTSLHDMEIALEHAHQAQRSWRRLEPEQRAKYLLEVRERLMDHRTELLELLMEETGKPYPDVFSELISLAETITYYTDKGPGLLAEEKVSMHLLKNKRVRVQYSPVGTVLNISPWNAPLDLAISPAIPALMAGNAVIIKPSELTPLTAMTAVNIMNDAGLPRGILQVLPGYGDVAATLCQYVNGIVFTGQTETGRKVARIAGERLIPCILELSQKNAMIVLNDADLERSAHGAVWGSFFHGGQSCLCVERIFVQDDVYDDFLRRVIQLTANLRLGDPADRRIEIGAITDPERILLYEEHIADAVHKGARILFGGKKIRGVDGYYFEPTILVDVTDEMKVMEEETLGPIMAIMKVRSPAEAVQRTNDSPFGLAASIWTRNGEVALDIASQLETGAVSINDVMLHYLATEAPYGGTKFSGRGRRKGPDELRAFTHSRTVIEDLLNLKREPFWYPYSETFTHAMDKAMAMLYRQKISRKISDLFGR
jgi:succinate-semialdehyde dehydrogenase / glutarate-semialdehyde dehydrogenase